VNQPGGKDRIGAVLARMNLPSVVDRDSLVASVAWRRGRPIRLAPVPHRLIPSNHYGMWLARVSDDVIVYTDDTSDVHATHIVCHEIAHMELGHDHDAIGDTTLDADRLRGLEPVVGSSAVLGAFGRSNYSSEQEYDAELLATHIMSRVSRRTANVDERTGRILGSF